MVVEQSEHIIEEVSKVIVGKQEVIEKVLMTIYAGGHILLEDYPGVGKTTLAVAMSKVMGLDYKRIQFTPDTMPSDIVGFSVYNRETGQLEYKPGAVNCHLLLGDEINRTSSKTQSALLEVMEEGNVTVDGITHAIPKPFICIATENPSGSIGTQALPDSQLDRFMVCLSIGYPSTEDQIRLIEQRRYVNPLDEAKKVVTRDDILEIQNYLSSVMVSENILRYVTVLCEQTRVHPLVEVGVSPRGIIAFTKMMRARAVLKERDYVIPEDAQYLFKDVCAHRLLLKPQARIEGKSAADILAEILTRVPAPSMRN
ncbi:MAG: MoxR family ATPase [Eubacteriales bacterium]|nr:MoxR family ATPase [Eubacteriales bacterium]